MKNLPTTFFAIFFVMISFPSYAQISPGGEFLSGGVGILIFAFLLTLAILWFVLPFIVMSINDKLKISTVILKEINSNLSEFKKLAALNSNVSNDDKMIPAKNYADSNGMKYDNVVESLREGRIKGRQIDGEWYVSS